MVSVDPYGVRVPVYSPTTFNDWYEDRVRRLWRRDRRWTVSVARWYPIGVVGERDGVWADCQDKRAARALAERAVAVGKSGSYDDVKAFLHSAPNLGDHRPDSDRPV